MLKNKLIRSMPGMLIAGALLVTGVASAATPSPDAQAQAAGLLSSTAHYDSDAATRRITHGGHSIANAAEDAQAQAMRVLRGVESSPKAIKPTQASAHEPDAQTMAARLLRGASS